jgi:serine/threonine-protein kinase
MKLCPKCGKHFSDDANFCPVDAARLTPLDAATSPDAAADPLASRFDLGERLGGATTGEVRKATDKTAGKTVAVKVVAAPVMALPQVAQRIERELKQLERVDSPAVAKVVASGKRGDQAWVATEFVPDVQTLAQALAARGPLDAASAAALVATIGEALIEAAKVGVVHRDLAPKNVLLIGGDPARVKLINFCAPSPTSEKAPGVPEYVAPEVLEGKQLDQRSNIYSLGAIYFHALTGTPPYGGELHAVHAAHLAGGVEAPSKRTGGAPDADALVLRALERNPAKRYLTVRQFVDEVQRVAKGGDAGGTQRLGGGTQPLGKGKPKEVIQTLMGVPPAAGTSGGTAKAEPVIELTPKAPAPAAAPAAAVVPPSAVPTVATPAVATAPTPPSQASPERSPWAPSAAAAAAGEPAFVQTAVAPAPASAAVAAVAAPAAAVVPAAPMVPAAASLPTTTGKGAAGGKKKPEEEKGQKGKFRETMWFKKGELDAAAAEAAAEEAARTGKATAPDKADSLPMEDRYKDDGTLSRGDRDKYSLKTGDTTMMPAVKVPEGGGTSRRGKGGVSEDELVSEMKGGRNTMLFVVVLVLAVIGGVVAFLTLR